MSTSSPHRLGTTVDRAGADGICFRHNTWHDTAMKIRRLHGACRVSGFRPARTVRGIFGDPKARVLRLTRRGKTVCGTCGTAHRTRPYHTRRPARDLSWRHTGGRGAASPTGKTPCRGKPSRRSRSSQPWRNGTGTASLRIAERRKRSPWGSWGIEHQDPLRPTSGLWSPR